jgi:hypothetical protein
VHQPFQPDGRIELPECGFGPVSAAEDRGFARNDLRANLLSGGNQCGGDVARTDILGQGRGDLPCDDVVGYPL